MFIKTIKGGHDRNFSYILVDRTTNKAAVIDPIKNNQELINEIKKYNVKFIINTHSHIDHIEGNEELKSLTGAKIIQHKLSNVKHDISIKDNQEIKLGHLTIKFLHTPGHSKDHICVWVEDNLFTGDLLFVEKIGGTGPFFKGSNPEEQFESLHKIMKLPENIKIFPGHDYGIKLSSTIKHEKETNPFLLCKTFKDFQFLKDNWLKYKKEHNIK